MIEKLKAGWFFDDGLECNKKIEDYNVEVNDIESVKISEENISIIVKKINEIIDFQNERTNQKTERKS